MLVAAVAAFTPRARASLFALSLQRALAKYRIEYRAGIHTVHIQAGCALVARLLATARVFEIAVKAGYVSC